MLPHRTPQRHPSARALAARLPVLVLLLLALAATAGSATSSPWAENPESAVRLVSPWGQAPATGEIVLGIHFRLPPHWHVYWKNSGDAGYPPVVEMVDTPEITGPELLWPAPHRYDIPGDLVALGYETEVVYPVRARIDATPGSTIPVTVDVDYLVCEVDCIPYRYELTLEQPIAAEGSEPTRHDTTGPLVATWLDELPLDLDAPGDDARGVTSRAALVPGRVSGEPPSLEILVEGARATEATDLFVDVSDAYRLGRPERLETGGDGVRFRVPLEAKQASDGPLESSPFAWVVTSLAAPGDGSGGSGGTGDDTFAVAASRTVEVSAAGLGLPAGGASEPSSPLALLGRALLTGLALGFAPGVLALSLAFAIAARRSLDPAPRALAVGLGALGAGLVLGIVDAAWSGGSLWQLPVRVSAIAAGLALAALGLALWLWRQWGRAHHRLAGNLPRRLALAAGAALPFLALGWLPPTLSEPLASAEALGGGLAVATFALFGLGLGLPHLAVGGVSAANRRASAHGERQPAASSAPVRLAEALGFLAATGVIWQVFVLSRQMGSESVAFIELALLSVALFAWARHRAEGRPVLATALTLAAMVAAVAVIWLAARHGAMGATATAALDSGFESSVSFRLPPDNILQGDSPS